MLLPRSVATFDVAEEGNLNFGYGRADHHLAEINASEARPAAGGFSRKRSTQHSFDDIDIRSAAVQRTVSVTLSALDEYHESGKCIPHAEHR